MKLPMLVFLIAVCWMLMTLGSFATWRIRRKKPGRVVWVDPPRENFPGLTHRTFLSKSMNRKVGFNIYLPPDYESSKKRYPVIYWLHGKEGTESKGIALSHKLHVRILGKRVPPMIMVFPNGGQITMYSDSVDGKMMSETAVIKELIPFIDKNYRTIASQEGRAIEGFSMGGFGALKLAFKYPEMFCSVVSGGAALHNLQSISTRRGEIYERMFNRDPEAFNANSPDELAKKNPDRIRRNLQIMMFVGSEDRLVSFNNRLDKLLEKLGIPHEYEIVEGLGHNRVGCYELVADEIFKFHVKRFAVKKRTSKPATSGPKKTKK
jgi:enterochelin esterase-like enzyme